MARPAEFLKQYNWLSAVFSYSVKTSMRTSTTPVSFPSNFRQYRLLQLFDAVQDTAFSSKSMARLFCHDHPETLVGETDIVDARPGRVLLAQSPFYPRGGGQLIQRRLLRRPASHTANFYINPVDTSR